MVPSQFLPRRLGTFSQLEALEASPDGEDSQGGPAGNASRLAALAILVGKLPVPLQSPFLGSNVSSNSDAAVYCVTLGRFLASLNLICKMEKTL